MPQKADKRVDMIGPENSSRSRSTCGRIPDSRMGACVACARFDAPIQVPSASHSLLPPAAFNMTAGGLRFDPGAFQHDVMMILYEPAMAARSEPNGTSCVVGMT